MSRLRSFGWLRTAPRLALEKDKLRPVTVVLHIENVIAESVQHLFVKRQDGLSRILEHDITRAGSIQLGFNCVVFGDEPYDNISWDIGVVQHLRQVYAGIFGDG